MKISREKSNMMNLTKDQMLNLAGRRVQLLASVNNGPNREGIVKSVTQGSRTARVVFPGGNTNDIAFENLFLIPATKEEIMIDLQDIEEQEKELREKIEFLEENKLEQIDELKFQVTKIRKRIVESQSPGEIEDILINLVKAKD